MINNNRIIIFKNFFCFIYNGLKSLFETNKVSIYFVIYISTINPTNTCMYVPLFRNFWLCHCLFLPLALFLLWLFSAHARKFQCKMLHLSCKNNKSGQRDFTLSRLAAHPVTDCAAHLRDAIGRVRDGMRLDYGLRALGFWFWGWSLLMAEWVKRRKFG